MKRITAMFCGLVLALGLVMTGCGDKAPAGSAGQTTAAGGSGSVGKEIPAADPVIGMYRLESMMGLSVDELAKGMGYETPDQARDAFSVEILDGGKAKIKMGDDDVSDVFWKADGDKIILSEKETPSAEEQENVQCVIQDGAMILTIGDESMYLAKAGSEAKALELAKAAGGTELSDLFHEVEKMSEEAESLASGASEAAESVAVGASEAAESVAAGASEAAESAASAAAEEMSKAAEAASEAASGAASETAAAAAAGDASGDAGKYMIESYEVGGQKIGHEQLVTAGMGDTYLWLKPDGKAELYLYNQKVDATWEPGVVTTFGTTKYTYTIDGDTLVLDMMGVYYTMVKEGGTPSEGSGAAAAPAAAAQSSEGEFYVLKSLGGFDMKAFAEMTGTTEEEASQMMTVLLKDGGKAVFSTDGEAAEITYTLSDDGKIVLTAEGETLEGTLKDGVLTFTMDDEEIVLVKAEGTGAAAETSAAETTAAETTAAETTAAETTAAETAAGAPADMPGGDGIVSDAAVKKSYVYFSEILNSKAFEMTYDDLVEYYGVPGKFIKEEYSDHMKANYRYFDWISDADKNTFVHINLKQGEDGIYRVSGYNSSGFTKQQAIDQYMDEVQAEEKEKSKAAAANMQTRDAVLEIYPFGAKDDPLKVGVKIPEKEWIEEVKNGSAKIYNTEDLKKTFGVGFFQIKTDKELEKFDFYKDKFENYQDIDSRVIGGVEMKGRTYKYIGYEWTEYVGETPDGRPVSIGIVRVDTEEGTVGGNILDSITFQ